MPEFAIVVLLDVTDGLSNEVTLECIDWTDVVNQLAVLPFEEWLAITVVRIEDLPKVMDGARMIG